MLKLGDDIGPVTKIVNDEQVVEFVSLRSPDPTPSRFTSEESAKEEGLPGAIVPGAMNIALVFRQMVPHNQPLLLSGIITDKDESGETTDLECDIVMENSEGVKLVIGHAEFALPRKS